jgi:5-methylcytosine-specific restriction endonuclease McrA
MWWTDAQQRFELLLFVMRRENGMCFYCDAVVSLEARKHLTKDTALAKKLFAATLDHLVPKSRRGEDTPENTVCACVACNMDRADRPAVDFLYERMTRRVE